MTSGANMNFDRLRLVSELADIGALREAMLATTIPESPGAFMHFINTVMADTNQDVTEFKYRQGRPVLCNGIYNEGITSYKSRTSLKSVFALSTCERHVLCLQDLHGDDVELWLCRFCGLLAQSACH